MRVKLIAFAYETKKVEKVITLQKQESTTLSDDIVGKFSRVL